MLNVSIYTQQEENLLWNSNFGILLIIRFLNTVLSMIAIQLKFKNQNLLIFNSVNFTNLSQAAKLNSVNIFILQGTQ